MCKNDRQVWCFGCGCKLENVKLAFSLEVEEYQEMEEECDSDDNDTMDMVRLFFSDWYYLLGMSNGINNKSLCNNILSIV